MRRFGRRKRGGGSENRAETIDAASVFARITEQGVVDAKSLEPLDGEAADAIPGDYAVVGRGEAADGSSLLVSFSPDSGGDAMLAGIAAAAASSAAPTPDSESSGETEGAQSKAGATFQGELLAVAPEWTAASRRRLALVGSLPFRFRAVGASGLADGGAVVEPERESEAALLPPSLVAAHIANPADRDLFQRAVVALEGLASKHGGAVRGAGRSVELVLMARRVAELRAEEGNIALHTLEPQKSSVRLSAEDLASVLDGLEGNLRRRLNDRRVRESEEGLRARVQGLLVSAQRLRFVAAWPLSGTDPEVIDLIGVTPDGLPVVAAVRQHLSLPALGEILDAAQRVRSSLATVLADADAPVQLDALRLVLAAAEFSEGVANVLPHLALAHDLYQIRGERDLELHSVSTGELATLPAPTSRRGGRSEGRGEDRSEGPGDGEGRSAGGRRSRRRGGRRRTGERSEREVAEPSDAEAGGEARGGHDAGGGGEGEGEGGGRRPRKFEEVSLFDLENEKSDGEGGGGRRRRGRRRGRRMSGGGDGGSESSKPREDREEDPRDEAPAGRRPRSPGRREPDADGSFLGDDEEEEFVLASLPDEVDVEEEAPPRRSADYDDDDETEEEAPDEPVAAQKSEAGKGERPEAPVEEARPVRRRSVIVAHADRDSILAAVLLARDLRLVEGLWVYSQSELMTFFRSVATDLREETPIYVLGFTASPARDVLQAASLYADRLYWFDHHDWPPEDLDALRHTVPEASVHVEPGVRSVLPLVMSMSTRRSRFSDKLVDLGTGRFTPHDYERWGRLWWARLGDVAARPGDARAAIEPLLAGRPSDLSKEAATAELPPLPPELEYASRRDFRLVHFGGFTMAIVDLSPELDPHLTARIVRARYHAGLSLAYFEGEETFFFSGDELDGRRFVDFAALVEHLAAKNEWVEALNAADHVARFRIVGLAEHPSRMDEVVSQIAMGRSILER